MNSDLNPLELFPQAFVPLNPRRVLYFNNLPFAAHLDKRKNNRFPFPGVTPVTQEDVSHLKGCSAPDFPYKDTEIRPWLIGKVHSVPSLLISTETSSDRRLDSDALDFGNEDGFFLPSSATASKLAFGGEDGLFLP